VKTFLDSSALAKRYVEEPGSEAVDEICAGATGLAVSVLCIPEIISALNRRVRERALTRNAYAQAKRCLANDVRDAQVINLTPPVISACTAVLEASPVRALDALHVACALEWEAELFVSADKKQVHAAKRTGLRTQIV
jgi:predicted nucleic acid-binding protein